VGDLTRNFSRAEFACKCGCGFDTVDFNLVHGLQDIVVLLEAYYGETIEVVAVINSGCRCENHNAAEGGARKSQHLYGRGADVVFLTLAYSWDKGAVPVEIVDSMVTQLNEMSAKGGSPNQLSIGIYSDRVHIDSRTGPAARWVAS